MKKALFELSQATRVALLGYGLVAAAQALAMVAFAWGLAKVLGGGNGLAVALGALIARALLSWAGQVLATRAAATVKRELRSRALDSALASGPEFIAAHGPDELTWLCTNGLDAIDAYFTTFLPALVATAVISPIIGMAVLATDPESALIIAATVILLPLFAALIGWYTERNVTKAAADNERLAGHLGELIRALPMLTAFGRAQAQNRSVARVSARHRRSVLATLKVAFCSALAMELIATVSVAIVAVSIGLRLIAGEMDLTTGLLVLILAPDCYLPIRKAGAAYHASADGIAGVDRVATIVGTGEGSGPNGVQPEPIRYQLRVRDLRVQRRHQHAPDGVDFDIAPGGITRLSSASGSGKSTIMAVLLGFVAPESGSITVDGVELSTVDPVAWRRQLAWIPQQPQFLGPTVAAELRLSVMDLTAAVSEARLLEVCERVHAHQLLHRSVHELSSGERARVALARALLRIDCGARILLADEPTAHLDPLTAAAAMRAIERCARDGAAVLLASHREVSDVTEAVVPQEVSVVHPASTAVAANPLRLLGWRGFAGIGLAAVSVLCGVALTATAGWLIARAAQHPAVMTLTVAIIAVRVFGLGRGVVRYLERLVTHDAAFRITGELRVRLWSALARIGPAGTAALRAGDGARRLVADVDTVRDLIPRVLNPPSVAVLAGALAVTVEWIVLPSAGVTLAGALLIAGVAGPLLAAATERRATVALAEDRRTLALRTGELLRCAAELSAVGADRLWRNKVRHIDGTLLRAARRQAYGAGIASALSIAALGTASVLGVLLGTQAGLDPVLLPMLALIPLACNDFIEPLAASVVNWRVLRMHYSRLAEILDTPAPPEHGLIRGKDIQLSTVDVGWPGAEPTLRDISLRIPAGSWVSVVGPSGSGKSTLLALLLGFLAPTKGTAQIPRTVALCPQDPQLVSTTLEENLRIADPDADATALRTALHTAGLDSFRPAQRIAAATVSGGEAQRIAIARALLAADKADAVLLDEPTAHLDVPTAQKVLANLRDQLTGQTVLHVTHDPAQTAQADLVLEISQGTVKLRQHTP